MQHIRRDLYLQRLIDKMHNGKVKIITGIRRCGKSYLLRHIFKEYLTFALLYGNINRLIELN